MNSSSFFLSPPRSAKIATFLCLVILMINKFFTLEIGAGYFVDEVLNVLASSFFFLKGIYSPLADQGRGYEVSVSSGLLTTWPSAVGWLLGGNLFWSRVLFFITNTSLFIFTSYLFFEKIVNSQKSKLELLILSFTIFLWLFLVVPYSGAAAIFIIGEIPAGILIVLGFLILQNQSKWGATLLGCAIWHGKFIYIPFAILALAWRATQNQPVRNWIREFSKLIFYFFCPLFIWFLIIFVTTGFNGFSKYLIDQLTIAIDIFGTYSGKTGLDAPPVPTGLQTLGYRLHSDQFEWVRYVFGMKIKILFLLFGPMILLGYSATKNFKRQMARTALFELALSLLFFALTLWFFAYHRYMFIRHLLPALLMGFAVIVFFANRWFSSKSEKIRIVTFAILLGVVITKETVRLPVWKQVRQSGDFAQRFSPQCKVDLPSQLTESLLRGCEKLNYRVFQGF